MENSKEFKVELPDGCSMTFVECEDEDIPKDFDGDIYYEEEEDPIYEVPVATGEPFRVGDILYKIVPRYGIYKKVGKYEYYVSLLNNLGDSIIYDLIPNIIKFLRAKSYNVNFDVYIDMGGPDDISTIVKVYNIGYLSYDLDIIDPDLTLELDFMTNEFVMDEFESMVYPCIERVVY